MKIGLVIPMQWNYMDERKAEYDDKCNNYNNALKKWAENNNIEVLDLYHDKLTFGFDLSDNKNYINEDGVHINMEGHKTYLSPRIGGFLYHLLKG